MLSNTAGRRAPLYLAMVGYLGRLTWLRIIFLKGSSSSWSNHHLSLNWCNYELDHYGVHRAWSFGGSSQGYLTMPVYRESEDRSSHEWCNQMIADFAILSCWIVFWETAKMHPDPDSEQHGLVTSDKQKSLDVNGCSPNWYAVENYSQPKIGPELTAGAYQVGVSLRNWSSNWRVKLLASRTNVHQWSMQLVVADAGQAFVHAGGPGFFQQGSPLVNWNQLLQVTLSPWSPLELLILVSFHDHHL